MTMEWKYPALYTVQEELDYWLEEGGKAYELRRQVKKAAMQVVQAISFNIGNYNRHKEQMIPALVLYMDALEQLDKWEQEYANSQRGGMEVTVGQLMEDYALFTGQVVLEGGRALSPYEYLEQYMEMAYQPPKEVCREFLARFGSHADDVEEWMDEIAWEEDEEE